MSAPGQLVPVHNADPSEIESGRRGGNRPWPPHAPSAGRLYRHIPQRDFADGRRPVDVHGGFLPVDAFRARVPSALGVDPTEIRFPTLVRGSFDAHQPAAQGDLDDGTTYRLWQVTGDFKNDFDLRHYPADRQTLVVRFFNARAASDSIVYVQDRRSSGDGDMGRARGAAPCRCGGGAVAATSRRQRPWRNPAITFGTPSRPRRFATSPNGIRCGRAEGRDNLVTQSALGDPRLVGLREHSRAFRLRSDGRTGSPHRSQRWPRRCCRSG